MAYSVADIALEIKGVKEALEVRLNSCSKKKLDESTLEAKLANSILSKLTNLPGITVADSATLFGDISESKLSQQASEMLSDAVEEKLSSSTDKLQEADTKSKGTQSCRYPLPFIIPEFLLMLFDPKKAFTTKLGDLADYMVGTVGLSNPDEQTYKWWYACAVAAHFKCVNSLPPYWHLFENLDFLKGLVNSQRRRVTFPFMPEYPKSPHQLPDGTYSQMYGELIFAAAEIENLTVIAGHHIPLRRTSHLLKQDAAKHTGAKVDPCPVKRMKVEQATAEDHGQPPASGSAEGAPAWAQQLIGLLQSSDRSAPTAGLRAAKQEQVVAGLRELHVQGDQAAPPWVSALIGLLAPPSDEPEPKAETKPEASNDESAVRTALTETMRPRKLLALRVASADASSSTAEKPSSSTAMTPKSMEAYEKEARDRMLYVKERRAKEREKEKEEKEKAAADAAKGATTEGGGAPKGPHMKRPAANKGTPLKNLSELAYSCIRKRPAGMFKRPAGAAPSCPEYDDATPTPYNGGVIYNPPTFGGFRCIREAGNYNSEKQIRWHGDIEEAWENALQAIDVARAEGTKFKPEKKR